MKRILFILLAFSILNQSIDFDYVVQPFLAAQNINYDDIDSITEFLLEEFMDDEGSTSEMDDDSGIPQNKPVYKAGFSIIYCSERVLLLQPVPGSPGNNERFPQNRNDRVCKGFFTIICPPPDIALLS